MEAKSIFEAMVEHYVRCTSYEDTGTVDQEIVYRKRTDIITANFSTIFIRPNLLRFNMTCVQSDFSSKLVIQSDGESFRQIVTFIPEDHLPSFVSAYDSFENGLKALAGATLGITTVTFTLMGIIESALSFQENETITRFDDEVVNGENCYKLGAIIKPLDRTDATVWISTENDALKKYQLFMTPTEQSHQETLKNRQLFEPEGFKNETDEFLCLTSNIHFNEITFNNSISVDKITSPLT